jgi:hypothetical protein
LLALAEVLLALAEVLLALAEVLLRWPDVLLAQAEVLLHWPTAVLLRPEVVSRRRIGVCDSEQVLLASTADCSISLCFQVDCEKALLHSAENGLDLPDRLVAAAHVVFMLGAGPS